MIKSFKLDVPKAVPDCIRDRVHNYPWSKISDLNGREFGSNHNYMKELCAHWVKEFDWIKQEDKINHFSTKINELCLHFVHEKGSAPEPILIGHSWSGSIVEFENN